MKRRVYVRQVWEGWADEVANRVVYGAFGRSSDRVKDENEPIHRFLRARRRWNRYVQNLKDKELIAENKAASMFNCRYRGVELNRKPPRWSCHCAFCPYCYYRWLTALMRRNAAWSGSERLDAITWRIGLGEDSVLSHSKARGAILFHRSIKSRLTERSRRSGCRGVSVASIRPVINPDETIYELRVVVIGTGLDRNVPRLERGEIEARFDIEASEAWAYLAYCAEWLDLPFDTGRVISEWNRSFRAASFSGSPKRRIRA